MINTWSQSGAGGFPTTESLLKNKPYGYFDQRDLDVVKYWLKNKKGGEIISVDMSNHARQNTYITDPFSSNQKFADVISWIRNLDPTQYPGSTTLPIMISEWYATPETSLDPHYNNAVKTDAIIKIIKAGGAIPLLWGGVESPKAVINPSLHTPTTDSTGGIPLPFATTVQSLKTSLSFQTTYYPTTSSSPSVSALAASGKTILVNTTPTIQTVDLYAQQYTLQPYQVTFITTPLIQTADNDHDGDVDFLDHLSYLTLFNSADPGGDFNQNGTIDIFDLNSLFLQLFH